MTITNEIHTCEVCGNTKLETVIDLGKHPLCDDLIAVGDKRTCAEFPIEILFCSSCTTAHQRFQVPKHELFPRSYHYRSRFTTDVLDGMSALVITCEKRLGSLKEKLVLDVGCNDGSLLNYFQDKGAKTLGIEPTDAYRDGMGKGHDLVNGFFSLQTAVELRKRHGIPDVITFTNVFAHIENLPEVIEALKILMSTDTMLVVENHYLGAVLDRHQFDTFYHEHPRTYSLTSFQRIAESLSVKLTGVEFPSRYGGNIRVFMGGPNMNLSDGTSSIESVLEEESHYGERLRTMQAEIEQWKTRMTARILDLVSKHGVLSCKAFPGRAAILVKLLGLDSNIISAVYEKPGSMKIGHYLPGTRIPILSDDDFFAQPSQSPVILNFAWHISVEINNYLTKRGYVGQVLDIIDPCEFGH